MYRDQSQLAYCQTVGVSPTNFAVIDTRDPNTTDVHYPLGKFWVNQTSQTLWYLNNFTSLNGTLSAEWVDFNSGSVIDVAVQTGTSPVVPLSGTITLNGAVVAAGTHPIRTDGVDPNTIDIELQISQAAAATDATKIGLAAFDSSAFSVDANGFVTLKGGSEAIDSLGVQATSGGGTNPVLPDVNGKIEMEGALVAAGTNPIRAVSTAVNTVQYQVQTSQALAATDSTKTGLCNFDSTQFSVDSNGFVSLTTPGPAFSQIALQTFSANGTYTPTAGMVYCIVEIVGAGGGGGAVASNGGGGTYSAAGGGGAGEYGYGIFTAADIGVSKSITIGAGGTGGAAGNNPGSTGGTTSFGTLMTAIGGNGGSGSAAVALIAVQIGGLGGSGGTVATSGYNSRGAIGYCGFSGVS